MYIMLGDIDLSENVTSEIKFNGGFWKVDQKNAISLTTSARKDKASGMSVEFQVTFDNEVEASALLAYIAQYSPENPSFDEELGAGISLYIRSAQWHYTVWSVTATKVREGKSSLDYLQYCYDVVCHLGPPFALGTAQTFTEEMCQQAMVAIEASPSGTVYGLDGDGALWTFAMPAGWTLFASQPPAALTRLAANDTYILGLTTSGTVYEWNGSSWTLMFGGLGGIVDISIASDNAIFAIKSDHLLYKWNGSSFSACGAFQNNRCSALSATECWVVWASDSKTYKHQYYGGHWNVSGPEGGDAISDISCSSQSTKIHAVTAAGNAVQWADPVWSSHGKQVSAVAVQGISGTSWWLDENGYIWEFSGGEWSQSGIAGTVEQSLDNSEGHFPGSPDISIDCEGGSDLTIAIADSESLILATQANSEENWAFFGGKKQVVETYEGDTSSLENWLLDWDWTSAPNAPPECFGGEIFLDSGRDSFILLSGPNKIIRPIKMTADLSLDSGGATGEAYVQISSDGSNWKTVFDQIRFESGEAVYGIPEAMGMRDCYVRLYCNSGTATHYLRIKSIKFEVTRAAKPLPEVPAGTAKTVTISITDGTTTIDGEFVPKRAMQ